METSFEKVRRRGILIIVGVLFISMIIIIFLAQLSVGFPWSILIERLWLLSSIVFGLILVGYIYLYFRLSVLRDLAFALKLDQPLSEDLVRPAARMMYSLPAAMALTGPVLLVLGTIVHALDLSLNFGFPIRAFLLLLASSVMILCFSSIALYFLLKSLFRPLYAELARRAPPEVIAGLDRAWQLPGGRRIEFNIPVRAKIFFGIFTMAAMGFWFAFLGYNMGMRFLEERPAVKGGAEPGLSHDTAPLRIKWAALLAFQGLLGAGLALLLGRLIAGDILFPLKDFKDSLAGDAESEGIIYSSLSEDELGEMVQAWDKRIKEIHAAARKKLAGLISTIVQLKEAISGIDEAAANVVELSIMQSENATTQVAMISEVSASSEELSSTAGTIAGHSDKIKGVTEMAQGEGDAGVEFVSNMIQQMENLRLNTAGIKADLEKFQKYTRDIHGILEIIEEISDQINLLSLNAELEAAGSGEAGRRFAVVASEIKRLASGTLTASDQIRRLIADILESSQTIARQSGFSAEMIDTSSAMANDVSNAFIQIFQYIQDITVLVKDIAEGTGQQKGATELISDNLREMLEAGTDFEKECERIQKEIDQLRNITRELKNFIDRETETGDKEK